MASHQANYTDYSSLFYDVSPYSWSYVGIGLALGLSIAGAAWFLSLSNPSKTKISLKGESLSLEPACWELRSKPRGLDQKT